jgi:predicted nucleic acid-binding protein
MRKTKLYLDTSIISHAIDDRTPETKQLTLKFFDEIKAGKYEVFVSELLLAEIDRADENTMKKLMGIVKDINPEELDINSEIEALAKKYISEDVIPLKYADDATHIAIASVNELDIIVSWNFEHIVKHKTRVKVTGINTLMGYKPIDICTPKEVIENV